MNQLQQMVLLTFNRITDTTIRLFIILIFLIYKWLLYMNFITILLCPWYLFLHLITVPNLSTGWDSTVEKWWGGRRIIMYVNEACWSYTLESLPYFVQFCLVYLSLHRGIRRFSFLILSFAKLLQTFFFFCFFFKPRNINSNIKASSGKYLYPVHWFQLN